MPDQTMGTTPKWGIKYALRSTIMQLAPGTTWPDGILKTMADSVDAALEKAATTLGTNTTKTITDALGTAFTTGQGSPIGVVTPTAVGALYSDTAATNGATLWQATGTANTAWTVINGDTGWRNITPTLPWANVTATCNITAGKLLVRRVGQTVYLRGDGLKFDATVNAYWDTVTPLPTGFTNLSSFRPVLVMGDNGVINEWHWAFYVGRYLYPTKALTGAGFLSPFATASTGAMGGEMSWSTSDPWPTTLPGTAA